MKPQRSAKGFPCVNDTEPTQSLYTKERSRKRAVLRSLSSAFISNNTRVQLSSPSPVPLFPEHKNPYTAGHVRSIVIYL